MKNIPPWWSIHRGRGDKVAFKPIGNLSFSVSFSIIVYVASTEPDVAIKDHKQLHQNISIKPSRCIVTLMAITPLRFPRRICGSSEKMRESLLNLIICFELCQQKPSTSVCYAILDSASKNRSEVEKMAQMWKDKQKVLEGQVEQEVAELTKVRSW